MGGCYNIRIIDYSSHLPHPFIKYDVFSIINYLGPANRGGSAKQCAILQM